MSPVCKKCLNYIMNFPCPHCGSEESFTDREETEIKPIVSREYQASFKEPVHTKPVHTKDIEALDNIEKAQSTSSVREPSLELLDEPMGEELESLIRNMAKEMKGLTTDIRTIMKSMKVVERILTNLNKELSKLR